MARCKMCGSLGKIQTLSSSWMFFMYNTGDKNMYLCCEHKIFPYMWINMGM